MFDDTWRFGGRRRHVGAESGRSHTRLDFTAISDPRWRLAAKYVFARLRPATRRSLSVCAFRVPDLASCRKRLAEAARWMNWLTAQQVPSLGDVTQDHCDRYLAQRCLRQGADGTVTGTLEESVARVAAAVIIELASYGDLLSADRYRDGFTPWNGRSSSSRGYAGATVNDALGTKTSAAAGGGACMTTTWPGLVAPGRGVQRRRRCPTGGRRDLPDQAGRLSLRQGRRR
jgi:hypothetical protein